MSGPGSYKDTLNLPHTEFAMKADLAKREPQFLESWQKSGLSQQIAEARKNAPLFLLHDGPPYSNGHIHYGHILNKILKDLVVKYHTMAGFRAPYVPGWDTHGLPIELAVDRELGSKRAAMSDAEVRAACREYALKFVEIQKREFIRLGVFGDWENPYLTLNPQYEAAIVRSLAAFARGGYLYRGQKPVYWCPQDGTALAEAEIEYHDHTSPSIYVKLPMAELDAGRLAAPLQGKRLALVIWTTTPWTIPANLAVVLHKDFEYVAIPSPRGADEFWLVARDLASTFLAAIGADVAESEWVSIPKLKLPILEGERYEHPWISPTTEQAFRVWFADYVTLEQGTGLVHTAPGHGADDYKTGVAHGLSAYAPVDARGRFTADVPEWQGQTTREANPKIVNFLAEKGVLLNQPGESLRHSYPHCWRCKGPILFRATPQWFVGLDHAELRQRALLEIDNTKWVPPWGRNRIHGMIEKRPDWCLSRQRVWGVPIPAFYCDTCDTAHASAEIMEHVANMFEIEGADAWYKKSASEMLPADFSCQCGGKSFRREKDIVDVWFESGASWFAVCAGKPELGDIDLYLEGSDQHRGWFHSSLLVGIAVAGKAPYKTVLTHGFVLDEQGKPYSKSEIEKARKEGKNIRFIPPEEVMTKFGAEMFRLWVASVEFRNDIPYSEAILAGLSDWYRKFRNTSRFMLGNINDFSPTEHSIEWLELSELDKYALAQLGDLVARVRAAYDNYEFHQVYRLLVDYTADISAFYLDIVKDRLYTEAANSPARRGAQAVLYQITSALARLIAPVLCFTAEDVWQHLPAKIDKTSSVHLADMPSGKLLEAESDMAQAWTCVRVYRERVTKALEEFRAQKRKSSDAQIVVTPTAEDVRWLRTLQSELAEVFIVSDVILAEPAAEPKIVANHAEGTRCERCWRYYKTMSSKPELCTRCEDAVNHARVAKGNNVVQANS